MAEQMRGMTIEGLIAFLQRYDPKTRVVFQVSDAPPYTPVKEIHQFTERLTENGQSSVVVVGVT